ncbi:MAG: type II/IV secretion system protein [Candidatus Nealsonbacteria bacterium]|nr:MAG: type II/IV secretion system protein [Candidatus Nealsonbacteria bacterium]
MPEISKKITGQVIIPTEILTEIQKEIKNLPSFKDKIEDSLKGRLTELLEIILGGTINLGASDIHIEPKEKEVKIRVRIDGLLQDVFSIDKKIYQKLVSRIKLVSGLKLNIDDRPQDGRFSVLIPEDVTKAITKSYMIEIRTSTLPTEYGETIVLRILNPKSLIDLETLGLREDLLKLVNKEIKKPNGMVIVTGPTGSGKTTTLYAFLKKVQKPENKIITIEDPIEYHLKGISQTQVNPAKGYDFANGLRSIMRQDPDVVLVGEIRDLETASIALQAALTGHLVFTTLHTNDAAGTIARLQALGEKPINIAPAINIAIAQRLVRKVCKSCFKLEKISPSDLKKLKKALKDIPKINKGWKIKPEIKIPKAVGCKDCNFTGYRERTGLYEAFLIDDELEKLILTFPSIAALREKAIKKGMITMYQDGMTKVLEKITTIEEVERVTGEE